MSVRALAHYHFKRGQEEAGKKFLENTFFPKAKEAGCTNIELLINEKDPANCISTGIWNTLQDANKFASTFQTLSKQLQEYCSSAPTRELLEVKAYSPVGAGTKHHH